MLGFLSLIVYIYSYLLIDMFRIGEYKNPFLVVTRKCYIFNYRNLYMLQFR